MTSTLVIANTGRGKSTVAKQLLKNARIEKREILVYDPNKEHSEFYAGKFTNRDEFLMLCSKKINSFILIEEATIFFSNKGRSDILTDLLVRKRHSNNKIVLLFHSLRSVPTYILELTNFVVLFKTADRENYINKIFEGYDDILGAYNILKNVPDDNKQNFHKNFVIELNKPVSYI
jgi:DNA helicase HerA-like ATPase